MATKPRARPVKVSDAKKAADARNKAAKLARTGKYSKAVKVQKEASKSRKMTKTEKQVIAAKPFVPQIVPQPPQTAVSEKGMTLRQLMKSTPRLMVENSYDCYITKLKRGKTKKGLPVVTSRVRFKDPFRPSAQVRLHEVLIVGLDDPFKPINKQKRVLVSCGCLSGNTKVLTDKGWKTIFELAEPLEPGKFPITYMIDGQAYQGSAPFHTGRKKVYKVTTSNGVDFEATADHRFLVKVGRNEPEWMELRDIKEGMNLVLSERQFPKLPEKNEDFYQMQYVGFMQGDGTLTNSDITKARPDLYIGCADKLNMVAKFEKLGIVSGLKLGSDGKAGRMLFTQRGYELLRKHHFDNINAPKWKNKKQFYGYLSGLLCADASVSSKDGKLLSVQIRGAKEYLYPVFEQMHRYGYSTTSIRLERAAGTETNIIKGANGRKKRAAISAKDLYCMTISSRDFEHLHKYLELTPRFYQFEFKPTKNLKYSLTKIQSIKYKSKQEVYDITVPGQHRFAIQGSIIAHNCENYVYMWEYANAVHGAARIIYGNGAPPSYTNPANQPGLCKHAYRLAREMIELGI